MTKQSSISEEITILAAINYFRSLNFFEEYSSQTDEELLSVLRKWRYEKWGKDFEPSHKWFDLQLLSWDEDRVWWKDTEADVCSGNTVYIKTLKEWGQISCNTFFPEEITENWESEDGPIQLSFYFKKRLVKLYPEFIDDYLDLAILKEVNHLICESGKQFEIYDVFDQTAFIVALTKEEKYQLSKDRHWKFA